MKKVIVNKEACMRCGACMAIADKVFTYGPEGESVPVVDMVEDDNKDVIAAMESCPTSAISLVDADSKENCDCDSCECENCECDGCDCEECEHEQVA